MKNTKNFLSASVALAALLFVSVNVSASQNQKPMTKELVADVLFDSRNTFNNHLIKALEKKLKRTLTSQESSAIWNLNEEMIMSELMKIKSNQSSLERTL